MTQLKKFKHKISEHEKLMIPILNVDDGWDEPWPPELQELQLDMSEEEPVLNIFDVEPFPSGYTFQYKNDPVFDTHLDIINSGTPFEEIEWDHNNVHISRKSEDSQQLSEESYTYLESKAKPQLILAEIADLIQNRLILKCFAEQIYYFDGIVWKELSNADELRCLTDDFLEVQNMLKQKEFTEIFNILRSRRRNLEELNINDKEIQEKINFLNGVYDIREDIMLDHSPEYPFLTCIPYEFQPGEIGNGDIFDGYLDSISHGNTSVHTRILQWIGYCISNLPTVKKIALLIGERDSRKTTLSRLISAIVGKENCQAFSFNHISRFTNDEMFGKKIGLCTDLKNSKLSPESIEWIKNQTGGDIVHAEVKYKGSYSYVSTCKYIIASNFRPNLGEDDALENRFLTIPFPEPIPDDQKNLNLLDDIKQEIQHVFYLSFEALRGFLDAGMKFADIGKLEYYIPKHFTNEETSVSDFFRECCYLEKGKKTSREEVYKRYSTYCNHNKKKTMHKAEFFRSFKKIMDENGIKDDTNNGRRYNGLALKDFSDGHNNANLSTR